MLLDAISRWPRALSSSLWPYAIEYANVIQYHKIMIRGPHTGETPIEIFARANVRPNLSIFHPFGCPVYVLNNRLQASQLNKWLPWARVGIYLGMSPHHARTVALVLNVRHWFHPNFTSRFMILLTQSPIQETSQSTFQHEKSKRGSVHQDK